MRLNIALLFNFPATTFAHSLTSDYLILIGIMLKSA